MSGSAKEDPSNEGNQESTKPESENHIKSTENTELKPKFKSQISMSDLERIVADTLKDVDDDEQYDDGDDDDPDLLNELSQIIQPETNQEQTDVGSALPTKDSVTGEVPVLLKQRIEMYKIAEENATSANESSRARRFCRGLSTLETMLKESLAGKAIDVEDIPPEVVVTKTKDSVPVEN